MSKCFLDTSILIYALDRHDPVKQRHSRDLLRTLQAERRAVISTQVLQEFFVTATRKLNVDPVRARAILASFRNMELITVSPELVFEAIDCSVLNQLSFWDALIIVSAESAGCPALMTEDLNPGQVVRGVEIQNPFA